MSVGAFRVENESFLEFGFEGLRRDWQRQKVSSFALVACECMLSLFRWDFADVTDGNWSSGFGLLFKATNKVATRKTQNNANFHKHNANLRKENAKQSKFPQGYSKQRKSPQAKPNGKQGTQKVNQQTRDPNQANH